MLTETDLESYFVEKLFRLNYIHRANLRDRAALERNFREKFEALNRIPLTIRPYRDVMNLIVTCIQENSGNGYTCHTAFSGKMFTSFKASTLSRLDDLITAETQTLEILKTHEQGPDAAAFPIPGGD